MVEKGIAVGIIAAQSMGEAATQLTLNTKHLSGRAGTDITQGLPRVEELFEARTPKAKAIIAAMDGKVKFVKDEADNITGLKLSANVKYDKEFEMEKGDTPEIKRAKTVQTGDILFTKKGGEVVHAPEEGQVSKVGDKIVLSVNKKIEDTYELSPKDIPIIEDGAAVIKGTALTLGSLDPKEVMELTDLTKAQVYLIDNIQETYGIQGIGIDDKHVEVIVRQMSRFYKILEPGDSSFLAGNFIEKSVLDEENKGIKAQGKKPGKGQRQLVGITVASIKTESFLSASSFEQQVRVLSEAAITGKYDLLRGLKENVIIGRTVPLGDEVR
jgi:DNA-directed RNA polymerase subunit beta'